MFAATFLAAALVVAAPTAGMPSPAWTSPLAATLRVVRGFAPPDVRWGAGHRGVDLASQAGAVVRAAGAGRISFADTLAGRGVVVVVHGELRTTYEPVAASVKVGAIVPGGAVIGRLQEGHNPASPSAGVLHWGLLRGRTYLDPMSLLDLPRPVRLLPRWGLSPAGAEPSAARPPPLTVPVAVVLPVLPAPARAPTPAQVPGPTNGRGVPEGLPALAVGLLALAAAGLLGRPP